VETRYVTRTDNSSNHDFVLWQGSERTILVKHESSNYILPKNIETPRYIYLSSVGDSSGTFHTELTSWLVNHPEIVFAFQPGRELDDGFEKYKPLYGRTNICIMNKQEAEGLLKRGDTDIKELLRALHASGPKLVLITDGPNGAYSFDGNEMLFVPMYPDPKPPYDRTGAGDAFASTVVSALALGVPLETALLWGPVNSMSVVQHAGAQEGLLSKEKIQEFLKNAPADYKITKIF
jgi:sugar/nucleoside kinase (ribokinase family)